MKRQTSKTEWEREMEKSTDNVAKRTHVKTFALLSLRKARCRKLLFYGFQCELNRCLSAHFRARLKDKLSSLLVSIPLCHWFLFFLFSCHVGLFFPFCLFLALTFTIHLWWMLARLKSYALKKWIWLFRSACCNFDVVSSVDSAVDRQLNEHNEKKGNSGYCWTESSAKPLRVKISDSFWPSCKWSKSKKRCRKKNLCESLKCITIWCCIVQSFFFRLA